MRRIPTTPVLVAAVLAAAGAFGLAGLQISRAMRGLERVDVFAPIELALAVVAAVGVVVWTWLVVENARRLLVAGRVADPPSPSAIAAAWAAPLVVAAAAVASVAFLERRLNSPETDTTSAIPLAVACVSLVATMLVSYKPLFLLSGVLRRLGTSTGDLARWVWVPLSMVIVGALALVGLRAGGAFGEDFAGVAPAWALGVVAIPPLVIVLALVWQGGRVVEEAVEVAFARRNQRIAGSDPTKRLGLFTRILRADPRPAARRDVRERIRVAPGAEVVRLALMIAVAGLALVSMVGALVMFLFWRESTGELLLDDQRERAWDALARLRSLERWLAIGLVAVAAVWSFVTVLNVRLASGRRRNPVLAAIAWPAAAVGIGLVAERVADADTIGVVVAGFAAQAACLYLPFFLLERSAAAIGARRGPLRLAFGLGVVLLVHIQGLGGLSTVVETAEVDRFGRIAGYLALAAVLEMIATIAATEMSTVISDASRTTADKHNFLADQRPAATPRPAPPEPGRAPSGRPVGAPVAMAAASTAPPTPSA